MKPFKRKEQKLNWILIMNERQIWEIERWIRGAKLTAAQVERLRKAFKGVLWMKKKKSKYWICSDILQKKKNGSVW